MPKIDLQGFRNKATMH